MKRLLVEKVDDLDSSDKTKPGEKGDLAGLAWRRVRVSGIVQGVGFRPTVFRLAQKYGLVGEVRNTARGVELVLGGGEAAIRTLLDELPRAIPAPGRIEGLDAEAIDALPGCHEFSIAPSIEAETIEVVIPPDQATCPECLRELFDQNDRRAGYPLITCTICGPRYSILEGLPYDRERTSMRDFPLCDDCRAEYSDPTDRRFHAETVACARCGPNIELISQSGVVACDDPLEETIGHLKAGRIVAIKGIGGYHLACDATNDGAVLALRRRKGRPHKPFAVLVADVDAAGRFCEVGEAEAEALESPEVPIVLLKRRSRGGKGFQPVDRTGKMPVLPIDGESGVGLSPSLAPDNNRLGVMLPYTPIQHLLARHFDALVMTSGNVTDEPIRHTEKGVQDLLYGGTAGFQPVDLNSANRLPAGPEDGGTGFQPVDLAEPIADFALTHPRRILNPSDDSVVVVQRGAPALVRRARGHVPTPLEFDADLPPILAVGADLKNACAFGLGRRVYMSPHIGDLEYPAAFRRHLEEIERFQAWFGEMPVAVVCDLHPGYHSTQNAHSLARQYGARLIEVQHHHAHIAACLAEHGLDEEIIGVAFDGTGYGTDGAVWGGEFLVASRAAFRRFGRLAYHALPGGEQAIHEPGRALAAYLIELFGTEQARAICRNHLSEDIDIDAIARALDGPVAAPLTSSMGRLFDTVGVLLGFPAKITYEAQNAIAVESLVSGEADSSYELEFRRAATPGPDDDPDLFEIGLRGLFENICHDLRSNVSREVIADRFHETVVEMIVAGCRRIGDRTGLKRIGLSGGCFANTVLVERASHRLEADGFEVLLRRQVPANDGGIAFGQLAAARL